MSSYPLNIFNNYYVLAASFLACLIILFYSIFTSAKAVLGAGLERCVILQAALQQKWWADFIEAWCYDSVYQSKELVNFWWWSGTGYGFRISFPFPSPTFGGDPLPDMDSGSVFHFPHHRGEDSLAFSHTVSGRFQDTRRSDWRRRGNESTTFWERAGRHLGLNSASLLVEIWHLGRRLLVVWLSGNALASINVVALRQTRLVLGWVTVCGRVNHFGM